MAEEHVKTQEHGTDTSRTPSAPLAGLKAGGYLWGTGRRKTAVARVRIRPGSGNILINKRASEQYFPAERDQQSVLAPLQTLEVLKAWDVWASVSGGGSTGQAEAVMLGLARALVKADPNSVIALKKHGLLTRDPRMVERKKYGQSGARKRFQFSKR